MHERVFLSITAGPTPQEVRPVVATEDPTVIDAALVAIQRSLGRANPVPTRRRRAADASLTVVPDAEVETGE